MEVSSSTTLMAPNSSTFYLSPYSPLTVMPLKSDGSLCMLETLSSSDTQGMMPNSSSPKLEDFLGVAHDFGSHERETMGLNLESLYSESKWLYPNIINMYHSHGEEQTATDQCLVVETKKRGSSKIAQKQPLRRKSLDTFGQKTSQFRGVTRHRWTGRYEAHLWDNTCKKVGQTRKGRQVYLGGYDKEEKAARAYDLAALKYWGSTTHINFPLEDYHQELEEMKSMSRQEFVAHLRRKSSGFSRGASIYRGVTRHHQHGRWQARIGRVAGNKDLYLGTFSTQEEAAEAYDVAAIKFRGVNAVTNFNVSRYDVERIVTSSILLAGELVRRNKTTTTSVTEDATIYCQQTACASPLKACNENRHKLITNDLSGDNMRSQHSNQSSLISSLSCASEESPDGKRATMASTTESMSSWVSSGHFPVFAAWTYA